MTIVRYAVYYGERADVRRRLWISSGGGLAIFLTGGVGLLIPKRRPLHGESEFAARPEIRNAGLLGSDGIILGQLRQFFLWWRYQPIVLGGQTGVALAAEPGASKGVSIVIPNLLECKQSVVCTDPKIENYRVTAGYRRSIGQEVHLFNPLSRDGRTARWNPLHYVSENHGERVDSLQLYAHMFYPTPDRGDPFWASGARALFLGIGLYLFETP